LQDINHTFAANFETYRSIFHFVIEKTLFIGGDST